MRQIIAIGGGGFGREIKDLKIEKYIVEQCRSENPNICFIPTATGDDQGYIDNFYKDPDLEREYALSLDFNREGNYPGMRTKNIELFIFLGKVQLKV